MLKNRENPRDSNEVEFPAKRHRCPNAKRIAAITSIQAMCSARSIACEYRVLSQITYKLRDAVEIFAQQLLLVLCCFPRALPVPSLVFGPVDLHPVNVGLAGMCPSMPREGLQFTRTGRPNRRVRGR